VLEWLAREADLSLVTDTWPKGTFNFSDSREYTVDEAIDLGNGLLLIKGYTLVRRDRMLMLIEVDVSGALDAIPASPLDTLDKKGDYEFVRVLFHLGKANPKAMDAIAEEVHKLLGPNGFMNLMPLTRDLVVTDVAHRVRQIRDALKRVESPDLRPAEPLKESARGAPNAPDGVRLLDSPRAFQEKLAEAISRQRQAENVIRSLLEQVRKGTPAETPEEIKKRAPNFWDELEAANKAVEFLRNQYATQVRLLELDVLHAEREYAAASSALSRAQRLPGGVISQSALDEMAYAAQAAEVRVEQRKAILELYRKIPDGRIESPKATELPKASR
jgi:hypothetical protein